MSPGRAEGIELLGGEKRLCCPGDLGEVEHERRKEALPSIPEPLAADAEQREVDQALRLDLPAGGQAEAVAGEERLEAGLAGAASKPRTSFRDSSFGCNWTDLRNAKLI